MPPSAALRRRAHLVEQAQRAGSAAEVFAVASSRLRHLVPFDAAAWLGTDPSTGLPTAPSRIDELDGVTQAMCSTHWQHELLAADVNLFRDLARSPTPSAALLRTVGDPDRSGRYCRFLRPLGLHDELRTVLRVGDAPWGTITLWRHHGNPAFTPDDEATLAELPPEPGVATDHGVLPVWMLITVYRAGAIRHGAGDGTARTRVRTKRGRWLVCHASCLRRPDGTVGTVALVIEPAQPAAVAPLVVEAYDLTDREQQVVRLIARGAATAEIADELYLSRHTVRDHVKAIFAKTGVSSRGELTAKLFAEFYEPIHASDIARAHSG